jgi:Zn-dependent protease with chaperone function
VKRRKPSTTFKPRFYPGPIEREAEACIARCMQALSLAEMPLPIPVEQWIERPLRLDFGVADLSHLGANVLGAAFIEEKSIVVSEQLLSNERRLRFTCAHELGHFMLHAKLCQAFRDTTSEPSQGTVLHEREADYFAAALLMPAEPAVQVILQVCQDENASPIKVREVVMTAEAQQRTPWQVTLGEALASRFLVSTSAAEYRVRELLQPAVGPFTTAARPPSFLMQR